MKQKSTYIFNFMKLTAIAVAMLFVMPEKAFSENVKPSHEYKIKAAFIYNFTKYINWSETAFSSKESPYNICVLGHNYFGKALVPLKKKTVRKRKFNIIFDKNVPEKNNCHIAFIDKNWDFILSDILKKLNSKNTLTVSDMENFAEKGGMIGFTHKKERIGLETNIQAFKKTDIVPKAKLLEVSTVIRK